MIERSEFTTKASKAHPEIMKLRFDQERSNLEDMPSHIRKPLFAILSEYTNGTVKRINNRWVEYKIDDNFLNEVKYKFNEE